MAQVDADVENEENAGLACQSIMKFEVKGFTMLDLKKLKEAGYHTVESIAFSTRKELLAVRGISTEKALRLQTEAYKLFPMGFTTASEVHFRRADCVRIKTGSQALDRLLGGGIETGSITELIGDNRTGKTQICHSLAVICQLPIDMGGAAGKCMWIDTGNTFRPEITVATAQRFGMGPSVFLENISIASCYNSEHQFHLAVAAAAMMSESRYALLIVDSGMSLFRANYNGKDEWENGRTAYRGFVHQLKRLANQFGIAVVITNQIHSCAMGSPIDNNDITTRLALRMGEGATRVCKVHQSPCLAEGEATFSITSAGIDDVQVAV